jgi:FdhE protein
LDFYYDLYEVQFQAKAGIAEPEIRDELAMRWRLEGGIPQLTFGQLPVEEESFAMLVGQVTATFLRHNPTWEPGHEDATPADLVTRARHVFETWESLTSPRPDQEADEQSGPDRLASMAVGFALAPYLQRAAEAILPHLELSLWKQGYCPVCGGSPNFSLLEEETGARRLMCSRCASLWEYPRIGCPFCGTTEAQPHYGSDDDLHRLYVCSECKRYLKAVDLRKARRVIHPIVERLLTVGMDLAAQQEGFGA